MSNHIDSTDELTRCLQHEWKRRRVEITRSAHRYHPVGRVVFFGFFNAATGAFDDGVLRIIHVVGHGGQLKTKLDKI